MQRLLKVTQEWCADTNSEVEEIIKNATKDGGVLSKKTVEVKQKKKGGEIYAEHYKVTTAVIYDDIWSDLLADDE